ncbi:hypothetical protein NDU88_006987, partial [Pleurodeles waltl]
QGTQVPPHHRRLPSRRLEETQHPAAPSLPLNPLVLVKRFGIKLIL